MTVNIKNLDKTRLFIKLYNHIQTTSFGNPEKMIKDFEAGKLLLAQYNNDYNRFDLYCDISKDEVEPTTFNSIYGNGKNVFEDIVMELNKELSLASTTVTVNAGEKEITKAVDVILPLSTAAANVATAKLPSAADSKSMTEQNEIQKQAQALQDKLQTMYNAEHSEYRRRYLNFTITGTVFEAPELRVARVKCKESLDKFAEKINIVEKIVKGLTIDTAEREALLGHKKDLETFSYPHISRTAAMIGELFAALDKQQVSAHKI